MILHRISLENYGLYAGAVTLELAPRRRGIAARPIVLIGGKNGAGKTTILEALRLALYGRRALGARVGQAEYEDYLRQRVHRAPLGSPPVTTSAVEIAFDYAEAGVVHRYQVRRAWACKANSVSETLELEKDGETITSVPREEWHHFLQELIPPGVSQLFFFDGEKIREIADDQDEDELATAIRGLLGIELVGRLRTDLGLYIARHQRSQDDEVAKRLEEVAREIGALERKSTTLAETVADLSSLRESHARVAEHTRRVFVGEGGDAAIRREAIRADHEAVARQIIRCQADLRDLANGLLPFAIAPKLMKSFEAALKTAASNRTGVRASAADFKAAIRAWKDDKVHARHARWSKEHWDDLMRFAAKLGRTTAAERVPTLSYVSDTEATLARLSEAETVARPRARHLYDELATLISRYRELDELLLRADTTNTTVLMADLSAAEQRLGATEANLKSATEELHQVRYQLSVLDRERRKVLEEQTDGASAAERSELAIRVSKTLASYERRLLEHKVERLRREFTKCFARLARKGDLVSEARIDGATFRVTLLDRHGREVDKAALSAGEKQVYAIAMLWALARASGRALPMIIDTPLARLDSEHRGNLVERYFPHASHQVVMLSTDTEIDQQMLTHLEASVSHTYHLQYRPDTGCTEVREGYFGEEAATWEDDRELQQA